MGNGGYFFTRKTTIIFEYKGRIKNDVLCSHKNYNKCKQIHTYKR